MLSDRNGSSSYTSGEIAFVFECVPRTVTKFLDRGIIPGVWRLPGSLDRRLPRQALLAYFETLEPVERGRRLKRLAEVDELRDQKVGRRKRLRIQGKTA